MEVLTWLFRGKAQVADLPPDWRLSSRCPVHVIITTLSKILKIILIFNIKRFCCKKVLQNLSQNSKLTLATDYSPDLQCRFKAKISSCENLDFQLRRPEELDVPHRT